VHSLEEYKLTLDEKKMELAVRRAELCIFELEVKKEERLEDIKRIEQNMELQRGVIKTTKEKMNNG